MPHSCTQKRRPRRCTSGPRASSTARRRRSTRSSRCWSASCRCCRATASASGSFRTTSGARCWVDYPHFDLGFHLRRTAVPSPGGDKELKELGARVLAQALDREKPLWELWMIEGLADGRWALVSKSHHCMVDGVSGTSLLSTLFDDDVGAEPEPWAPGRGADGPGARHASARDTAVLLRGADRRLGRDDGGGQPPDGHDAVRAVPRGPGSAAPGDRNPRTLGAPGTRGPAPALDLGALPARRRQGHPRRPRRHGQRRRPSGDRRRPSARCCRHAASPRRAARSRPWSPCPSAATRSPAR